MTGPDPRAVVHVSTEPDMETRARIFNEGYTAAVEQEIAAGPVTEAEGLLVDNAMDLHMHGHAISNSPHYFSCDAACRRRALRDAVQKVLDERLTARAERVEEGTS